MEEILPGIYRWSWFSEEKKYDFNGYVIISGQETVIIDPPSTAPEDFEWLRQLKSVFCILLTNRDHVRESESFRKKLSSRILIHEKDAPLIDIKADGTFRDQDRLPGGLVTVHVPDNKSPGETALFLGRDRGVMFLGDALIGNPPGQLNLMPADKYANVEKAREGIRVLLNYQFESVLAGDGSPILAGGKQAVQEFLEKR